jgi:hypothetical protein
MWKKTIPFAILALTAFAAEAQHAHVSKYAGQENRAIKSLSDEDIAELKRGGGWGLARATELNGLPGPAHLLELKNEIGLSTEQLEKITALHGDMRTKAIAEGERLIGLEQALEEKFRSGTVSDDELRRALSEIADSRASLRFIHLSTHLRTPAILSAEQVARYNTLRGYTENPCASVPEGHDPVMWRRHNNCN